MRIIMNNDHKHLNNYANSIKGNSQMNNEHKHLNNYRKYEKMNRFSQSRL